MREAFFNQLYSLMKEDGRIMLLLGDVGALQVDKLSQDFPDRVINMGIAEENMMGVAAGLAMSGRLPFIFTHAIFATISGYEQIKLDICAHNLPVKIIGCGPGLDYANLGPSHHATEDIALMRVLPNMTIFSPCDNTQAAAFARMSLGILGPVYIRLDRRGEPLIHQDGEDFSTGLSVLQNGYDGKCVVATGRAVHRALSNYSESRVIDLYQLKPVNQELLVNSVGGREVITLEEHNIIGGIGSIVAEALAEAHCGLTRKGVADKFCFFYGPREYVQEEAGL